MSSAILRPSRHLRRTLSFSLLELSRTLPLRSATSILPGAVGFATYGPLTTGNIGAGDLFMALVGGDVSLGSVDTASNGNVYIGDVSMFEANGGFDNFDVNAVLAQDPIATGGSITINGPVTTGMMQAAAGTTLTLGAVDASQSVDVSAGGLADFEGTVSAPTITVTSSDINVAAGASLGVYGITDLLTLNAVSDQPIILGSGAETAAGQYVLNEAGDIQSANVVINALGIDGGAAPDIEIYNATIDGSQSDGGGTSSVIINTDSSIIVEGALDYVDAAPTDALTLNAGNAIEVVTDVGGSIAMTDNLGDLSGTLNSHGT